MASDNRREELLMKRDSDSYTGLKVHPLAGTATAINHTHLSVHLLLLFVQFLLFLVKGILSNTD